MGNTSCIDLRHKVTERILYFCSTALKFKRILGQRKREGGTKNDQTTGIHYSCITMLRAVDKGTWLVGEVGTKVPPKILQEFSSKRGFRATEVAPSRLC